MAKKIQATSTQTETGDRTIISALPKPFKGLLKRLAILNRTASACTFRFKESFTPDVSGKVTSPSAVTVERYVVKVAAGDSIDIDGEPIAKFLHQFAVNIDQQPVDISYDIELE